MRVGLWSGCSDVENLLRSWLQQFSLSKHDFFFVTSFSGLRLPSVRAVWAGMVERVNGQANNREQELCEGEQEIQEAVEDPGRGPLPPPLSFLVFTLLDLHDN